MWKARWPLGDAQAATHYLAQFAEFCFVDLLCTRMAEIGFPQTLPGTGQTVSNSKKDGIVPECFLRVILSPASELDISVS